MIRSIEDLLHPHDPARLDAAMLANARLHLKGGRAAEFARLLPWEVFNTLPTAERLLSAELTIVQRARPAFFDLAAPGTRYGSARPLRAEALHGLCEQGMSLVLNHVEHHVARVAALNAMIERRYRAAVATNCYASFRKESAFPPHFDGHNVLVLQLHGSKRWYCHGQPYRFPRANGRFPSPEDPGPVEAEIVMEPGDLLFLPRGDMHWAEIEGSSSMHLTIAIQAPVGSGAVQWLADRAEAEQIAREDINPIESAEAREQRTAALRAMLHRLADTLDLDAFLADADRQREPMRPFNLGQLQELQAETLVLASLRRRIALPEDGNLNLAGRTVSLVPGERAVLALLLERDGLTVAGLAAACPAMEPRAVQDAVAGLAGKALVFLFPPD